MEVRIMTDAKNNSSLLQALDKGIDDMLSGREYSYEEARNKIAQIREVRKNEKKTCSTDS